MKVISGNMSEVGPLSHGVLKDEILNTAIVPLKVDGTFETGDFTSQAELAFKNLQAVVEDAGGSLEDIVQVMIYLTDIRDTPKMNEVWKKYFSKPYPNRATFGITALTVPDLKIELVATANIKKD